MTRTRNAFSISRAMLYVHTLRHLRWEQVVGRLRLRLIKPRLRLLVAPERRPAFLVFASAGFPAASFRPPMTFSFLGETADLAGADWDDPLRSLLWRYNLHYFDDLNAAGATDRFDAHHALMTRWVGENPPLRGTAWAPYPTSLRVVNWIKWLSRNAAHVDEFALSLAQQADVLSQCVETHLLGNHVFENARALVFAGTFFVGPAAEAWLHDGLNILDRELDEQFLADGGHFERSPMYQGAMLWGLLDLIELARGVELPVLNARLAAWSRLFIQGGRWLSAMSHPDGEIAFFNDAAFGVAPTVAQLRTRAAELDLRDVAEYPLPIPTVVVRDLARSGYVSVDAFEARLIVDTAPVGPDYLPGHAHADTLSFELSILGERVLVNGGTSCYGTSVERNRQRGTAAHNTVEVDGSNSSEVWGGFRVARRAFPFDRHIRSNEDAAEIACTHDGYKRLRGKVLHRRRWVFGRRKLEIVDTLAGRYRRAVAYFHLHPDVRLVSSDATHVCMQLKSGRMVTLKVSEGDVAVQEDTWHPRFGMAVPATCLALSMRGAEMRTFLSWDGEGAN